MPTERAALALPFAVRLRPESQEYFAVEPFLPRTEPQNGTVITMGAESTSDRRALRAHDAAPTKAARVDRGGDASGEAVTDLLPHAYWATLADEPRKASMVRAYLGLADKIDVFRVTMPESLDDLPELLDRIEELVLRPAGAP